GTTGAVTSTALLSTLAPGDATTGTLSTGNVNLSANSPTYAVDLNNGSSDQTSVTGTVSLGTTDPLTVNVIASPTLNTYTIINNDGADAISGTFNNQAEGSTLTSGGRTFRITYAGGDGNDVVLTDVSGTGVTKTWDGGGADNNWTTAANWSTDVAPAS